MCHFEMYSKNAKSTIAVFFLLEFDFACALPKIIEMEKLFFTLFIFFLSSLSEVSN